MKINRNAYDRYSESDEKLFSESDLKTKLNSNYSFDSIDDWPDVDNKKIIVTVSIEGSGDSGSINHVDIEPMPSDEVFAALLEEEIGNAAIGVLSNQFPGWEIDGGSDSEMTFTVDADLLVTFDADNSTHTSHYSETSEKSLSNAGVGFALEGNKLSLFYQVAQEDALSNLQERDPSPSM